jgi:hypothetical protein
MKVLRHTTYALRYMVRMNHTATDAVPAFEQRRVLPGCEPALFIDGARYKDRAPVGPAEQEYIDDWNILAPLTIEAVEIYTGAAAPIEFQHPCGVILIWTRRK